MNLDKHEWFVAIMFGVMIDLDHLFAAPKFIGEHGWAGFLKPTWDDGSGLQWRSLFHEPIGAFVVAPLAIGWRYFVPLLFWTAHVGLDKLQNSTLAYSAPVESVLLVAVCSGLVVVSYRRWGDGRDEVSFRLFVADVGSRARSGMAGYGRSIRERLGSI